VVLVNFFATWCFPCIGVLGLLQQFQSKYGDRGFVVLAVGMDLEGPEVLEPFVTQYQLFFPVLVADERMRRGETPIGPITSLPRTVLFGKDGRLIAAFAGVPVPGELEELIARSLGLR
jgi:thiol-disulfide isomerase/thioredoxin